MAAWSNTKHIRYVCQACSHGGGVAQQYRAPQNRHTDPCMTDMLPNEEQGQWLTGAEILPSFSIPMSAEGALASSSS